MTLRPPLPKEHGSWVMFATAFLGGVAITKRPSAAVALYLIAALFIFVIRQPLNLLARIKNRRTAGGYYREELLRWIGLYAIGAAIPGLVLIVSFERPMLIPIGLAGAALVGIDVHRSSLTARPTLWSEVAGAAGLALNGLGAYYSASGHLDKASAQLTLLLLMHFVAAVFYVRMKSSWVVSPPADLAARLKTGSLNIACSLGTLTATIGLALAGQLPPLSWLAMAPSAIRYILDTFIGARETNFRRRGWIETGFTAAYLGLLILAFRIQ